MIKDKFDICPLWFKFKYVDIDALLRENLNPSQYEAVTTISGPVLVVAGAGTGKTRVIEYRVLYLVSQGVDPRSILLLTFTRKAARTMLLRAARHNRACEHVVGGTFHSFAYSVLSKYARLLGFSTPFSFLDEADSEEALQRLSLRLGLLEKKKRFPRKSTLKHIISASINREESIDDVILREYPHFFEYRSDINRLKRAYAKYKIEHNLLDYDDLLIYLRLLLEKEEVRNALSNRYRYIMVDEYQDTNRIQARIVYGLSGEQRNVMAVGDDAQSIYGFRGACYKNMFEFIEVFPDARVIKLEDNYRSTQPILDLANSIITLAREKYTKVLKAQDKEGERPKLIFFKDADEEAEWIADSVKSLRDEGIPLHHIGILFRSTYLARPLELALSKRNIPYTLYGGLKFIETAHIKDIIAHLKVLLNPKDELAWHRVLMLIENVGPKTTESIIASIMKSGWEEALSKRERGYRYSSGISRLLSSLKRAREKGLPDMLDTLISYYRPILELRYDDYQRRLGDLDSLRQIAGRYRDLERLLLDLVAIEPAERGIDEVRSFYHDERPLVLSTIHSAKGLEWEVVFIIGVSDGALPISHSHEAEDELEEERRLLYVATTRAKRRLFLSLHHEGYRGGITIYNRLSRFLQEPSVLNRLDLEGLEVDWSSRDTLYTRDELLERL